MRTHDNQPAFPLSDSCCEYGGTNRSAANGMTLRDYFATKASEEDIIASKEGIAMVDVVFEDGFGIKRIKRALPHNWRQIARYRHADAMLAAREAGNA